MERKKWTAKTEISPALLKFREKRKWQLALRRYVLEKNISSNYAIYFGISIQEFREWIELQFTGELNWDNFGSAWQFDHLVPVAYFDFSIEEDLILCWNFINIRVQKIDADKEGISGIIGVKAYFNSLYDNTGFPLCSKMIDKLNVLEKLNIKNEPSIEEFLNKNKDRLTVIASLTKEEFNNLNTGTSLKDILLEREILKKFG